MHAAAWKAHRGTNRYKLQISEISGKRMFNRLYKEYSSDCWEIIGDGYGKKEGHYIILAAREFESEEQWLSWARQCDLDLVEQTLSGKPKPFKLGNNYKPRKGV
jgi:hypothetical protein